MPCLFPRRDWFPQSLWDTDDEASVMKPVREEAGKELVIDRIRVGVDVNPRFGFG